MGESFYGAYGPFRGTSEPSGGVVESFYHTVESFHGAEEPFCHTGKPFYGPVESFYGTGKSSGGAEESSGEAGFWRKQAKKGFLRAFFGFFGPLGTVRLTGG